MNLSWLKYVETIAPVILSTIPQVAPFVPYISVGIQLAEQIPGATGVQKQQFAVALAQLGAQAANTAAGKTVVDPNAIGTTLDESIDAVVAAVNAAHPKTPAAKS